MNETMKTLLERRSVRVFSQEQIKDEELNNIIEAGKFAPSAMNQQPWHFTVVQSQDVKNRINQAIKNIMLNSGNKAFEDRAKAENFSAFYNAPTYIIVSGDQKAIAPVNDCSLALGNMFNAAASMSIGSCWIHAITYLFNSEEGKALGVELGIPEGYAPLCSGAFGYNAGPSPKTAPRKENTVNIIK